MTAHQSIGRIRATAEGHVLGVRLQDEFEEIFTRNMRAGADTGGRKNHFAAGLFGDEFREIFRRVIFRNGENFRRCRDHRNRLQHRAGKTLVAIQRLVDRQSRCCDEQHIAVRCGLDDSLGRDIGAGTGAIFDHDIATALFLHARANDARDGIGRAARRKANDEIEIGLLRLRGARHHNRKCNQRTKFEFHFCPPVGWHFKPPNECIKDGDRASSQIRLPHEQ